MSRLGKTPIQLPKGIEIKKEGNKVRVKGPKGELFLDLIAQIGLKVEDDQVIVEKMQASDSFYGLYRTLIQNLVIGVSQGFEKRLKLIGVGFRAAVSGNVLDLQIGFSHPTKLAIPENISVKVEKSVLIIITGLDKQKVGQFAATVRALRPPEPYKGKGIRYENEYVRKKAGKAAKK